MLDKLEQIEARYEGLTAELSSPEVYSDPANYAKLNKQHRSLGEIVTKYREWKQMKSELSGAKELFDSADDEEMRELARAEMASLEERIEKTEEDLRVLLLPRDPNDEKNVILEIRAGTGGQSVNTTYSAVRITHMPTGLVVSMQDEKSQIKNREKAMRVLRARLQELEEQKQHEALASERRSMVGYGNRSEKIRTYNFKENRVSDHRIGLTIHQLDLVMEGQLDEIVNALVTHYQAEKLKAETVAV